MKRIFGKRATLLNKALCYKMVIWLIPLSPQLSTWFMDVPKCKLEHTKALWLMKRYVVPLWKGGSFNTNFVVVPPFSGMCHPFFIRQSCKIGSKMSRARVFNRFFWTGFLNRISEQTLLNGGQNELSQFKSSWFLNRFLNSVPQQGFSILFLNRVTQQNELRTCEVKI